MNCCATLSSNFTLKRARTPGRNKRKHLTVAKKKNEESKLKWEHKNWSFSDKWEAKNEF